MFTKQLYNLKKITAVFVSVQYMINELSFIASSRNGLSMILD